MATLHCIISNASYFHVAVSSDCFLPLLCTSSFLLHVVTLSRLSFCFQAFVVMRAILVIRTNSQDIMWCDAHSPSSFTSLISFIPLHSVHILSGGAQHSLFLSSQGILLASGSGLHGKLGSGNEDTIWVPTAITTAAKNESKDACPSGGFGQCPVVSIAASENNSAAIDCFGQVRRESEQRVTTE